MPGQLNNIQIIQNYFNSDAISLGFSGYTFTELVFKNNIVKGNISSSLRLHTNVLFPLLKIIFLVEMLP